ncbi:MAG: hypothetical protein KAU62_00675 [Candidatus Heimdallarchaeota archaeon]|nr:hypothetical protein [Candidatus Heimdallarchaeota archaeon]MCK4609646.1 hypothetical protein [Candidatus Heimdallarchaeota archaeon]
MNWKMVFVIYVEGKEGKIELTRQKITTVDGLQFFLKNFFEEQKGWMIEEREKRAWSYEIVFVDMMGREVKVKKLHELIHESEEIMRVFEMTERTIGHLLAEGIS